MPTPPIDFTLNCPIPISDYPQVLLAHGGGGQLTQQLIDKLFAPAFSNPQLDELHDGATLRFGDIRLAYSTDSFVVHPLFFPGGDIGSLAVNGTVNDVAMCGARPLYLSAGFIIEEGLPMETLWRIVSSMKDAAAQSGVQIVTGDTKVVDRGKGDGVYINTSGVGRIETPLTITASQVTPGDAILINGDLARHGMAIMAQREGLEFENDIESDCAPLNGLVQTLLDAGIEIHCLRDLTRGGLASTMVEIAESSHTQLRIHETKIPVREDVEAVCEILGIDPLYVANEGKLAVFVPQAEAERTLEIMRKHPYGNESCLIGEVNESSEEGVILVSRIGAERVIDRISGEQLPRIC